ncbi:protein-tyrosine phosphatase [Klenkia soli]|uniref:protein-tyrosine-phosphatase n=1 Tax=Klenkia soli TaxID=1052260 RepID=A0A1H0EGK5_9ACTN|nr:low molecular weight protein-tyrosine-phosphatase [Klenkia soli]SDN81460.1 protein-tyrosine phosphatase [Klenkia soli]
MSTAEDPYRVSMVCLGNICRSPIAEVVLREMVEQEGLDVVVTSAGTSSWHVGGPMDPGSAAVLAEHGLDPTRHVAQQMTADRVEEFDLLVAMDRSNLADLEEMVGDRRRPRVVLLRDFDTDTDTDPDGDPDRSVPDPYGGGPEGFATVYAQVEAACAGLVARLPDLVRER